VCCIFQLLGVFGFVERLFGASGFADLVGQRGGCVLLQLGDGGRAYGQAALVAAGVNVLVDGVKAGQHGSHAHGPADKPGAHEATS
jgi:hypothetical protein